MRSLGAALALAFALASDAGAQQAARRDQPVVGNPAPTVQVAAGIDVSVPPSTPSTPIPMGPVIRTANIIADKELQKLLQNGFPATLHYKADLWSRGGMFDDQSVGGVGRPGALRTADEDVSRGALRRRSGGESRSLRALRGRTSRRCPTIPAEDSRATHARPAVLHRVARGQSAVDVRPRRDRAVAPR